MRRRLEALEGRRQVGTGYVVYVTDEQLADPAVVEAAIAEHCRRTDWTGAVMVVPHEVRVEEWIASQQAG